MVNASNPFWSLALSLLAFTGTALLLGLIAAAFVFALEELGGRSVVNRVAVEQWLRPFRKYLKSDFRDLLGHRSSLPYKQLTGTIASLFQSIPFQKTEPANAPAAGPPDLQLNFALIGARIVGADSDVLYAPDEPYPIPGGPPTPSSARATARNFFAERALDDLQAHLAVTWTRGRYLMAAFVVIIVFVVISIPQMATISTQYGFFQTLLTYPLIWVVAVLFTPIFRDSIEWLTAHQR